MLTSGDEKFSLLHSSSVAAASRPTTTGRRAAKTDRTTGASMYFMNSLLISIISTSDGSTSAKVAVALPRMAVSSP